MSKNKSSIPESWTKILDGQKSFGIVAATLLILIPALYWNSLDVPFHYDDQRNIQKNTSIQITNLSFDQFKLCWTSSTRPVAMVSFALNYYFGGLKVAGYHVVNILIHLTAALFLYLFIYNTLKLPSIRETDSSHAWHIAFLATLLWATSPVQTQAVTYLVQRMTSMSAMFFIISMYFYLKGRVDPGKEKKGIFLSLSLFSWLLAMGSKENAFMLPAVLFIYDFFLIQSLNKKNTARFIKWTFFLLPFCIFFAVKAYLGFNEYGEYFFTLRERLLTEPRIIFLYISLLLFPNSNRLVLLHDIPLSNSLLDPVTTAISILGIAVIPLAALIFARKQPLFSFCALFFFINHLIESSFLPLHLIFEHRVYLPSMLFFVPIATMLFQGIRALSNRKHLIYLIISFIVIVLLSQCYDTIHRNNVWKTSYSLWNDVLNKSPNLSEGHSNMAYLLREQGAYHEAYKALKESIRLDSFTNKSSKVATYLNLISNYYTLKQYDDAMEACKTILEITDSHPFINYYIGVIHKIKGDYEIAIGYLNSALTKDENFVLALKGLGDLYLEIKEPTKALVLFEKVQKLTPRDLESRVHEAIAYRMMGNFGRAVVLMKPFMKEFDRNNQWSVKAILTLLECQYQLEDNEGIKNTKAKFLTAMKPEKIDSIRTILLQNKGGVAKHVNVDRVLAILDGNK
jgi:tetratricopeptide (TPR) repeat protein